VTVAEPVIDPTSRTVGLTANSSKAGTVSGGGTYSKGSLITVKATASSGYVFESWTEGSTMVSQDASYSFNLGENDHYLLANFVQVMPDKLNQPADKTWLITFSRPVSTNELNSGKIYVATDVKGSNKVAALKIEAVAANNCQLSIKPPATNWISGQTYYLILEPGLQSAAGENLSIKTRMKFTIQ
jgi:hypothetical protein